ncbi:MAG TPA: HNH endonuclease [Mycobacteriales bacterium]|nr:HNH endonuclease [Mycobacteriales bacterium]
MASGRRHFIYPLTATSGYNFGRGRAITPDNYLPDALAGKTDEWGLAKNYLVLHKGDWIWAYFGGKVRQVHGVGRVQGLGYKSQWKRNVVYIDWDAALTAELQDRPIFYEDYQQRVQGAVERANDETTAVLERWLRRVRSGGADAPTSSNVRRVPRETLVRIGQGAFRNATLKRFGRACAITRTHEEWTLQAAHIVPVAEGGTHSAPNALLLRADLHNLFDRGLISVTSRLTVDVDRSVTDAAYRALQGRPVALPTGVPKYEFAANLARHRAARRVGSA